MNNNNPNPGAKHVANILGEWGRWQFKWTVFVFVMMAISAINNMGYAFHAFDNDFWCSDVPPDLMNKTQVCHRAHLASMSQVFYMLGYFVSGLIFSHYSDKYGRRPIIFTSFIIEIIGIVSCILSPNIYFYSISRFFVGMVIENCGPKYRADIYVLTDIGWVLGYAAIPGLAYWLRDYRYMQLTSLIATIFLLLWYYLLCESPRWLLSTGRIGRAEHILRKALKTNGLSDENLGDQLKGLSEYLQNVQSSDKSKQNHTVLDLVKTSNLRKISMIMWYTHAVVALLYYGISLNMSDFGGNFYITFLLSGLVELPSQLLTVVFFRLFGRRLLFSTFLTITSVSCLAIIGSRAEWLTVLLALIGKFGVNSAWNVMAVVGPELYPTVIRHRGMGVAQVVGRLGSISAPYMKNLAAIHGLAPVMILYGVLSGVGALIVLLLPETKGREIPDTIEETDQDNIINT
ncbi:unnamed protein product [Oppiella nova]|uniref:Organic cation transporter protein n=1 Tax=Oppiella nova TaxID=334625 RepID=A0A7R9QDN9_9ACAR|nr:unnamed protein product [Oppiella nova]CAG2162928.1 unnamed protein product [Oppiella nova]